MLGLIFVLSVGIAKPVVSLGAGLGAEATTGPGAHGTGRLLFNLDERWSIGAISTEGLLFLSEGSGPWTLGTIGFFASRQTSSNWSFRGGFEHHHLTPWGTFKHAPVGSLAGSGQGITHRSGAEVAVGHLWGLPELSERASTMVELVASAQPGSGGPNLFLGLEIGAMIDLGKDR